MPKRVFDKTIRLSGVVYMTWRQFEISFGKHGHLLPKHYHAVDLKGIAVVKPK